MKANLTCFMQFIYPCVNEKHELDETLLFLQCLVLFLRDKLSFPPQCLNISSLFRLNCGEG